MLIYFLSICIWLLSWKCTICNWKRITFSRVLKLAEYWSGLGSQRRLTYLIAVSSNAKVTWKSVAECLRSATFDSLWLTGFCSRCLRLSCVRLFVPIVTFFVARAARLADLSEQRRARCDAKLAADTHTNTHANTQQILRYCSLSSLS